MTCEELFLSAAIGKLIMVFRSGVYSDVKLEWAGKYAIGVRHLDGADVVVLVYKHSIEAIGVIGDAPSGQVPTAP